MDTKAYDYEDKAMLTAKRITEEARQYLLDRPGVTTEILNQHVYNWKQKKRNTLTSLYRSMLMHAKNRGGMPNYIGDLDNLRGVLCNFRHKRVLKEYGDWRALLRKIKQSKIRLPSKIVMNNPRNSWVIYSKSVISCAKFLSSFNSVSDFNEFVDAFYRNEHSRLALPLLLEKELFGYGFALACDFLKENGYSGFIKPDTHTKDLARGLGITDAKTDYLVFKDVIAYCLKNDLIPYEFDKLLWLIGSGNFYLSGFKVQTSKWEFMRSLKKYG